MMKSNAIILATLLLAACGKPAADGGESPASQAAAPVDVKRQFGSWKSLHYTMAFEASEVKGPVADIAKAAKASIGRKDASDPVCVTAEIAAKDDLNTRLQEIIHYGPEWKVTRSTVKDGAVDFAASMDDPQSGKGEMTITGTITPTTTDLVLTTDSHEPAPGKGHIRSVMKQENTRVGDCTPGEMTAG